MNFTHVVIVGIGGMLGSMGRYILSKLFETRTLNFPYSTFTINLIGSFIIGVVFSLAARKYLSDEWSLFLGAGICGGFTTFSAFSLENLNLIQEKPLLSLAYILASVVGGIVSAAVGVWVGRSF